jgi:hypothetical protein
MRDPRQILDTALRVKRRADSERAGYNYAAHGYPATADLSAPTLDGPLDEWIDAYTEGPEINKWRHYPGIYHRHFDRFRGGPLTMLEIGVSYGGSMRMWRDYFGDDMDLHGVDINPDCKRHETDGVTVHIGDQPDLAFWARFLEQVGQLDIVVDDGGHEAHQQIASLQALLPHVKPGGVYLIEDIHAVDHQFHDYVAGLARNLSSTDTFNAFRGEIESITTYPFMVVIEKRTQRLWLRSEEHGTPRFGP